MSRVACIIGLICAIAAYAAPAPAMAEDGDFKRVEFEFEPDAYYTSFDMFINMTNEPVPDAGTKKEFEIYRGLLLSSHIPRIVVVEASVNPMPVLGEFIKRKSPGFYSDMQLTEELNLIKAATAGFEEPYAISLFLGNVVKFTRKGALEAGNRGFMGYLLSYGDKHIKDNEYIDDRWWELEWKIKGDKDFPELKLSWSFRVGLKFHSNDDITDVYYISLRRSSLDFNASAWSFIDNSAFEYTYEMDAEGLDDVQHYFFVEKKLPIRQIKSAVTLAIGFIYDSGRKYSGSLANEESFELILRPNIEF